VLRAAQKELRIGMQLCLVIAPARGMPRAAMTRLPSGCSGYRRS
jgi:hypothetical protein